MNFPIKYLFSHLSTHPLREALHLGFSLSFVEYNEAWKTRNDDNNIHHVTLTQRFSPIIKSSSSRVHIFTTPCMLDSE